MTAADASLKGKIRALAKRNGLRPQGLLHMYLFEHLLLRLEQSKYSDKFVLKGGLLVSSMTGVAQRTTMDMDTTVVGVDMSEESVTRVVRSVCAEEIGDGMKYVLERIEPIREDDLYANWRAHVRVLFGKIDAPIKIDITTGDEIVPGKMVYEYPLMLEEGSVRVLSYPLETVLAEKLETVLSRGTANTRARDYYDIHLLTNAKRSAIDNDVLREAVAATAKRRGSSVKLASFATILENVCTSNAMHEVWLAYLDNAHYVGELKFEEVIESVWKLAEAAGLAG